MLLLFVLFYFDVASDTPATTLLSRDASTRIRAMMLSRLLI